MLTTTIPAEALRALERTLHEEIPLSCAMGVTVLRCDGQGLALAAPLSPNINHKLTAFGGSLANLATLAGWGLLQLLLRERAPVTVVIQECRVAYRRPVTGDFTAVCAPPAPEVWARFLARLERRGVARIELAAHIPAGEPVAVRFEGRFAAFDRRRYPAVSSQ